MLGIHLDSSDCLYAGTDSLFQMLVVWLVVDYRMTQDLRPTGASVALGCTLLLRLLY